MEIPDDDKFAEAVRLLSSAQCNGRGFFLAVFIVRDGGETCDFHLHQNASEQMVEALLRDVIHDPKYERAVKSAFGLPFNPDPIGQTAGTA